MDGFIQQWEKNAIKVLVSFDNSAIPLLRSSPIANVENANKCIVQILLANQHQECYINAERTNVINNFLRCHVLHRCASCSGGSNHGGSF